MYKSKWLTIQEDSPSSLEPPPIKSLVFFSSFFRSSGKKTKHPKFDKNSGWKKNSTNNPLAISIATATLSTKHRGSALRETIASQSEGYIRRIDHLVTWAIAIRGGGQQRKVVSGYPTYWGRWQIPKYWGENLAQQQSGIFPKDDPTDESFETSPPRKACEFLFFCMRSVK